VAHWITRIAIVVPLLLVAVPNGTVALRIGGAGVLGPAHVPPSPAVA